jgi:hypothetical protein
MISCRLISETVAKSYGVTVRDLNSRRVDKAIILPRHMSWTLARKLTERTLPEIGRHMGGRDHTTIMYGIRKIEAEIDADPEIASNYSHLVEAITVLGEASETADRIAVRFHDIDPLETAETVLEAKFRDVIPSMEAIRALCMGVQHFAAELSSAEECSREVLAEAKTWQEERAALQDRLSNLTLGASRTDELLQATALVVSKFKALRNAEYSAGERPARKALEDSLKALQTTFERNSNG